MSDRFWVGQTGNWSDALNHWSATDGGAPNASKPTSSDNVYFTANSFNGAGQTVTVDESANCKDMDWTGTTDTPTLAHASQIAFSGSVIFIAAMSHTGTQRLLWFGGDASFTAGGILSCGLSTYATPPSSALILQDALNIGTRPILMARGTLDTNGQTVTCGLIQRDGTEATGFALGASVINCTSFNFASTTQLTFAANTSTIKVIGTGIFAGGGLTYNNVELNGTAHTISGSNTFNTLIFKDATTQTITFTDGTTQTITTPVFTGESGKVKTLTGTGAGGWAIIKAGGGYVEFDYLSIDRSTATPASTWYAGQNSTDGGNNSGWFFSNRLKRGWWSK